MGAAEDTAQAPRRPFWVLTTYFAEGFPYSLVRQVSTVFFKDNGASLQAVGLTSLYGLPWVLKFLWAPLVDAFSTKRRWLLTAETALVAAACAMAFGSGLPRPLAVVAVLFLVVGFLSATHDIAIDGFYLEALDRTRQARYVGYQAMAYRLAMIAGGGGIIWLSGATGWSPAFLIAAAVLGSLFLYHLFLLPRIEVSKRPARELARLLVSRRALVFVGLVAVAAVGLSWLAGLVEAVLPPLSTVPADMGFSRIKPAIPSAGFVLVAFLALLLLALANLSRLKRRLYGSDSFYARAFVAYLDQPKIGVILAFLVLYRTGESFLLGMVYPMLSHAGVTRAQYGLMYGTFGISASIVGGILGGHLIGRFGLRRVIWPLVLAQNIPNLLYAFVAWRYAAGVPLIRSDLAAITVFVMVEAMGAGLGTAAFMVFIMRTTKPEYKAAHMSIATSIMNVSNTLAGVFSGFLAAWLGFPLFFVFTFLATFPSMALVLFLPRDKLVDQVPPAA